MSKKTEQRRHEALARETGSWTSWTVRQWFTNGHMALLMDDPFNGPEMRMEFECACPTVDDFNDHADDLSRPCVFLDTYERDERINDALSRALRSAMDCRGNRFVEIEREPFPHPDFPGLMCYRACITDADDARAWVALPQRQVDAIERSARPDRWAWFQLVDGDDSPSAVAIWAMRGERNQAVGLLMPSPCTGSAIERATPTYTGTALP